MNLKLLLTAAAMSAAAATAAHATDYDLGPLAADASITTNTINVGSGFNTNIFYFSLANTVDEFSTGAFTQGGSFAITDVDLFLYKGIADAPGSTIIASTGPFDPQTQANVTLESPYAIGPGEYSILVDTVTPTGKVGAYTVEATTVSAAPEPSTWAFMIAGLAMVGGLLRFRRRNGLSAVAA